MNKIIKIMFLSLLIGCSKNHEIGGLVYDLTEDFNSTVIEYKSNECFESNKKKSANFSIAFEDVSDYKRDLRLVIMLNNEFIYDSNFKQKIKFYCKSLKEDDSANMRFGFYLIQDSLIHLWTTKNSFKVHSNEDLMVLLPRLNTEEYKISASASKQK